MTDHSFYRRNNRKPTRSQRSSISAKGIFSKIWAYCAATSSNGLPHWRRTYWAARTRMTNLPLQPYQTRLAYRLENTQTRKQQNPQIRVCNQIRLLGGSYLHLQLHQWWRCLWHLFCQIRLQFVS